MLLRVYTLRQPQMIPYEPAYGGCKSWLDLTQAIVQHSGFTEALAASLPVLEDLEYDDRRNEIRAIVAQQ